MSPRWHATDQASLYFYFSEPHVRPHVAVRGKGWSCTVALDDFSLLAGSGRPPKSAMTQVIELLRANQELARRAFEETAAHRFPGTLEDMKEAADE